MNRSTKRVKDLKEIVGDRIFVVPKSMANDIDIVTGGRCLSVGVNGKWTYIPVEQPTPIPYSVFCALKDIGILNYYQTYEEGKYVE